MKSTESITESILSNGHIHPEFLPIGSWFINDWGRTVTVVAHHVCDVSAQPSEPYGC
jgi:hypothetical protein